MPIKKIFTLKRKENVSHDHVEPQKLQAEAVIDKSCPQPEPVSTPVPTLRPAPVPAPTATSAPPQRSRLNVRRRRR